MAIIDPERVKKAYAALGTLDEKIMDEYWDKDMVWQVPGHNILSGWYHGRTAFINFMKRVGELSGGSFHMEVITITTNEEYSTDVTNNQGNRAGAPDVKLNIDVGHTLRWKNGKVVAGKGGIFGDGTDQYDHFWGYRVE
jgi:ketosteroid isomerase-like protein